MIKYAQIDVSTGSCISVSFLSGEVEAENMILLTDEDDVSPRDTYNDGEWIKYVPPEPEPPGPTNEERIASLEEENINLMLALTQVYEEKEADKARLEQENIDTMLAVTEIYEMMIGGS